MFYRKGMGQNLVGLLRIVDWIGDGECLNCDLCGFRG